MQSQWPQAPPPQSPPPQQRRSRGWSLASRLAFAAGALFAAASAVFKKRRLSRAPLDMLLLAGWCAAAQLAGGLVVAPPLLLALHGVTARQTLYDPARFAALHPAVRPVVRRDARGEAGALPAHLLPGVVMLVGALAPPSHAAVSAAATPPVARLGTSPPSGAIRLRPARRTPAPGRHLGGAACA